MDIPNEPDQNEIKQLAETLQETVLRNDGDSISTSINSTMNESLEKENPKNPLLFRPVISCVLKFLNIENIKNCRLVSREWGFNGKLALASRALIRIENPDRLPNKFHSCFLDSATLFSAFDISGALTKATKSMKYFTVEELAMFFDQQQKYIKELYFSLEYAEEDEQDVVQNLDISSWIAKSPMVQKDAKYMTRLSIIISGDGGEEMLEILPLKLIQHIKGLVLSDCRISLEAGIKICPVTLRLVHVTFYQKGIRLDRVQINDIVDFCNTQTLSLSCCCHCHYSTKYNLDMRGSVNLEYLNLDGVEIVNGETSQWNIESVDISNVPYSLNSLMEIQELELSRVGAIDLFTLPTSLQNLTLNFQSDTPAVRCSQPIVWEKLKYLQILRQCRGAKIEGSLISHFRNCPQLTHLTLDLNWYPDVKMKFLFFPKSVTTLILQGSGFHFVDGGSLNLKKLVLFSVGGKSAKKICKANIQVDEVVMMTNSDEDLVDFLKDRKRIGFGKTLYVGGIIWYNKKFEDSVLKEHVDVQSSFYVFENQEKGRAFSREEFEEFVPPEEHLDIRWLP